MLKTDEKKEEKEEKNYDYGQNQLGDLDKKLNDEIFSVKMKALATSPDPVRPKKIIDDQRDINFIDLDMPSTLTWNVYDSIPAGLYDSITFIFGINEEKNQSHIFVNPPESNMEWPDVIGGGYHYMMFNGKWVDTLSQIENFNFHMGIGQLYKSNVVSIDSIYAFVQNYFKVTIPNSLFTISEGKTRQIEIIMNIDSWF